MHYASQQTLCVPRTKIGIYKLVSKITYTARRRHLRLKRLERQVVDCRCIEGDAVVIHRVGPVCADLNFEGGILAGAADRFHSNARGSKILCQPPVIYPKLDKITNPLWRKFHC